MIDADVIVPASLVEQFDHETRAAGIEVYFANDDAYLGWCLGIDQPVELTFKAEPAQVDRLRSTYGHHG